MKKKTFQGEIARDKTQTYVWGDVKRSKREEITEKHPFLFSLEFQRFELRLISFFALSPGFITPAGAW